MTSALYADAADPTSAALLQKREHVRVATWNCFGAPPTADDFFEGRPFWPERLESRAVIETLTMFDIVCVQENLVARVRASLERIQREAGFLELWCDPMGPDLEDGTFAGGGLAILSRFPMRVRFQRLPRGAGPDGFARKGFAIADVTMPSGRVLHVVNTHLQADDSLVPLEQCRRARREQLRLLAEALAPYKRSPAILCGDLNIAHGTDEYEEMRRALGDELHDLAAKAGLTTYDAQVNDVAAAFHSGGPERALIDYIMAMEARFVPKDVRVILDEPLPDLSGAPATYTRPRGFVSDHFGIGVTLEIVH